MSIEKRDYKEIDDCLARIKDLQVQALKDIAYCLQRQMHSRMTTCKMKYGRQTAKNDYRNYVWLSVVIDDMEFWVTSFFLDVDTKSGNIHSQFGRLQFWKNLFVNSKDAVSSPNHMAEDEIHYMFCPENSYDPGMFLYGKDYSPRGAALAFNSFMAKALHESREQRGKR